MRKYARFFALVFIFTIPWENAFTIASLGTLSRVIGLVAAGFWLISIVVTHRIRKIKLFHIVVFCFVLFNIVSMFWTFDIDLSILRAKTYIQLGILTWILWDQFATPESLRAAMQAFILGGYVAVASTIYNFISGQTISQTELGRFAGAGQNAVELALILSLCMPVAWHLATTHKASSIVDRSKVINFVYLPIAFIAIILTGSRTALITIIPALIYIFGTMHRVNRIYRFLVIAICIVAVFYGQSFFPSSTLDRLGTIGYSIATGDLGGRMVLWKESISIFLEHPLLGIGSGSLLASNQLGAVAHNTFLSILAELGIIGFLLFLAVLAIVILSAINQPKPYSILWLTVLSIWIIGVLSLTYEYTKPTWFFLNMIVISSAIYNRHSTLIEGKHISENSWASQGAANLMPSRKGKFSQKSIL